MSLAPGDIHVLHVDDEPEVADLAAEYLEREDDRLAVETATTGREGLDLLDEHDYDCIVSDHDMPGQNGIEFLEAVREEHLDLPFILYTGKGSEEVASEAISVGVTDYLQKGTGTSQYKVLANRIQNAVAQYEAESAVESTQRRYRRLIEETSDVIIILDSEGNFEYLSPAAEDILGYPSQELNGESGFEYIHPEDHDRAMERFTRMVEDPSHRATAEFRFERPDGSWVWLEARGRNLLDDPEIGGLVVYTRDVTERKEREQESERDRARLNALFQHSVDAIVFAEFVDGEPIVRDVNAAFEETFGYDEASAIGRPIDELVLPDESDKLQEAEDLNRRIEAGELVVTEVRRQSADGVRDFLLQSTPLEPGESGTGTYAIYSDITERKEREEAFERQNERLGEFAGVVSHALRNPLNVAEGRLELAMQDRESEHLDSVAQALDRMEALIDDVLSLARAGETVGEMETVELAALVEACWQNVETASATLVADSEITFQADKTRLLQLLENLFRNAVEHAGEDVTVTVGKLDDGFYVVDDGSGIPPEDRDDVFDAGHSTSEAGTGFGLSIVKQIAEAHDWDIRISEGSVGGARFEISGVDFGDE